ncbi:MAG: valine--pyruvate transaminase [Cyanobacteria bacterium P01_A01_bin.17]
MPPSLTQFGTQMSKLTGVRAIMKDIIDTLGTAQGQSFINLSAGNPVILGPIAQLWRDCTADLLSSPDYSEVVCRYGMSQGYQPLIEAIIQDFNQRYNLQLNARQILITPGSQALYFLAANAFGGYTTEEELKQVVLPLSPDYTGYGGVSLTPASLLAYKPRIDLEDRKHRFKYRPDFARLCFDRQTGCVIFSRPCNPTGNVLTDAEVRQIVNLTQPLNIPVFIDSAYGPPFPGLNYTEYQPVFAPNVVHCMSLSKAGLPGERVGIAIGDQAIIQTLEAFQTNVCIHSGRYGQAIATRAINSGALAQLSSTVIRPYYQAKLNILETALEQHFPDNIPWFLHVGEGAIFGWLWFQNLPISDWDLYQELKAAGVLVVPGSPFFPGLQQDWQHIHECIRISLTATDTEIEQGIKTIAAILPKIYSSKESARAR